MKFQSAGGWLLSRVLPGYLSLSAQLIAKANYFWYISKGSLGVIAAAQAVGALTNTFPDCEHPGVPGARRV